MPTRTTSTYGVFEVRYLRGSKPPGRLGHAQWTETVLSVKVGSTTEKILVTTQLTSIIVFPS